MSSLLIIYSTTDGHAKRIACFLRDRLNKNNNKIELHNVVDLKDIKLDIFDKVVVVASIRYGKFNKSLRQFVARYETYLNKTKTAFISINLIARKPEKNTPETNIYTKKYLKKTGWKPGLVCVIAGVLDYQKYGLFDRHIIRLIMKITGGPTDLASKTEYTDWEKLENFANEIDLF